MLSRNAAAYVVQVHALIEMGAVLVPLNTRLTPAELRRLVRDADLRLLVHDGEYAATARAAAASDVPAVELADLVRQHQVASAPAQVRIDPVATHSIIYTSGTTGTPKGVVLTHGNHLASARASAANLGVRPDDRWLACLPFFHVGGLAILMRCAIDGTPVVVQDRFDPAEANRAVAEQGVTLLSVVPAMLARMFEERGERTYPPTLRAVLLGGGPAPMPLLAECARRGMPVLPTYGMTETASQVVTMPPGEVGRPPGVVGRPLAGVELRIERDGEAVPAGGEGEIVVRGPSVSPGYWRRPEETARAWRGGWFHTGDVGRLDADGYLSVLDRRDDLIISGGENIAPAEVEAVLLGHPLVAEAGVVGRPDVRWGQVPLAFIVPRPGAAIGRDELRAYCRERLAGYKVPADVVFVGELARNASGKVLRRELRARTAAESP